jgi:hypothetical protein
MPESPRWLAMKDRTEDARLILERLHANAHDPEHIYARTEFIQIRKQIEIDRNLPSSWVHIFKKPSYRKRAFLAMGTTGFIQFSGVLVINNYGPSLYKGLGFSPEQQLEYPAAWLTFGVGCAIMAVGITDRFPRHYLMSFGMFGCCACLACEAALVAVYSNTGNHTGLQAAVAMFFIFEIFYGGCLDGGSSFSCFTCSLLAIDAPY